MRSSGPSSIRRAGTAGAHDAPKKKPTACAHASKHSADRCRQTRKSPSGSQPSCVPATKAETTAHRDRSKKFHANGVWKIDAQRYRVIGFLPSGAGAHGLYPSRNAKLLYVSNRGEGSISVVSFRTRRVVAKWRIRGGGSPDMGGVSADGKVLWLSGRYIGVVYAISTRNGRLLVRIRAGAGPHGLCVWLQPGRYSLGHTGILR